MDLKSTQSMRDFFRSGKTQPVKFRRSCLKKLHGAILAKENDILTALYKDLGKNSVEAYTSEIVFVLSEIKHALKNLSKWSKSRQTKTPFLLWPGKSSVRPVPKGIVLILGPWNYPFQLVFGPFIGALAAGNCAVIKPSELAPHTASVINDIIKSVFHPDHCHVVQGDALAAEKLCALPWDHVFFTGSTRVGRAVMETSSKNLNPVTLELGGKNPCFVLKDVDTCIAAERIVWGKFFNAGQTCIAPDTLYVDKKITEKLLLDIKKTLLRFFGSNPQKSPDYGRIVNTAHVKRLAGYLHNVEIVTGGQYDVENRYFSPTIVKNIPDNSPLLQEEIFGPILPVIEFEDLREQITRLQHQPKPLALYIFSKSISLQNVLLESLPSGTACINETIKQAVSSYLPFGGIGESGMGQYHGKATFDCFTHYQSVFKTGYKGFGFHYPPYKVKFEFIKRFLRFFI